MRRWSLSAVVIFIALAFLLTSVWRSAAQQSAPPAQQQQGPPPGSGRGGPTVPATQPVPRDNARHKSFLEIASRGDIDLLFVGDSITDWWARGGKAVWDQYFAPLKSAN